MSWTIEAFSQAVADRLVIMHREMFQWLGVVTESRSGALCLL